MKKDIFRINISQTSEFSALVELGDEINEEINKRVRNFCTYVEKHPVDYFIECIPYYSSVSVNYDPLKIDNDSPFEVIKVIVEDILYKLDGSFDDEEYIVKIPVCYGGEVGPDIENVAQINKLNVDDVIKIHSEERYLVYMIGFAPGFPYLGGMSERISSPRHQSPRNVIPAGSVGIAGMQTGVYSIETPGGWQIIGRTPLKLFDINRNPKSFLKSGDIVKFYPISYEEYLNLKEEK